MLLARSLAKASTIGIASDSSFKSPVALAAHFTSLSSLAVAGVFTNSSKAFFSAGSVRLSRNEAKSWISDTRVFESSAL